MLGKETGGLTGHVRSWARACARNRNVRSSFLAPTSGGSHSCWGKRADSTPLETSGLPRREEGFRIILSGGGSQVSRARQTNPMSCAKGSSNYRLTDHTPRPTVFY